ncbi:MAG: tyrosine-type recombinase/integrase [Dermatophilaceae bacterium]
MKTRGPKYKRLTRGGYARTRGGKLIQEEPGRGRRWLVEYRSPYTGRSWSRAFHDRDEAVEYRALLDHSTFQFWEEKQLRELALREELERRETVPTFREVAAKMVAERSAKWRPNTLDQHQRHLRLRLLPTLGDKRIDEITSSEITELMDSWPVSSTTAGGAFDLLVQVFRYAQSEGHITRSPMQSRTRPESSTEERVRVLTDAEMRRLADAAPDWARGLFILGAATGMRRQELAGLTVDDVLSSPRGFLRVRQQLLSWSRKTGAVVGPTKADPKKGRMVPVADALAKSLRDRAKGRARGEFLFLHEDGQPLEPHRMQRLFASVLAASKLRVPEGTGWHILRHSRITLWMEAGIPVGSISAASGHSQAVLLARYSHATDRAFDRLRNATYELTRTEDPDF